LGAGTAGTYPVIDFGELELPEATDLVRGQPFVVDPAIDRVLRDTEVVRNGFNGDPGFGRHQILVSFSTQVTSRRGPSGAGRSGSG